MDPNIDFRTAPMAHKWVYWYPIRRMDDIYRYLYKHCWDNIDGVWVLDMEVFQAGMGVEAVRALTHYIVSSLISGV